MKVIITGTSGMVGEGVLHECINDSKIDKILIINRKSIYYYHPKVEELLLPDFFNIGNTLSQIKDYDACFFCLGVSSLGMDKQEYYKLTYTLTMNFVTAIAQQNPTLTFCYISGAGTDSSEKGRLAWARVKGKTENDLMKLDFKSVYGVRPGYLQPIKGMKNTHPYYAYIKWIYPLWSLLAPNTVNTLSQLGKAMINLAKKGYSKKIVGIADINKLAKKKG